MNISQLTPRAVPIMWGRRDVPQHYMASHIPDEPVGEIWFEDPTGGSQELLIKSGDLI